MWSLIKSWSYAIAMTANIIAILVALFFIISDAIKGLSYKNNSLMLATLAMMGWVGICHFLRTSGKTDLSTNMAMLPAIPILGYALLILLFIILKPDMR
ncbi:MAG: hypothetical protein K1X68_14075 [Saprospiraceae bacterium]|nr:hypothetical protein [Saprospiraceae bacterium]HMW39945.1 hypothetical protein [Saprospiraceae bacterium]HMX89360.1 hypothetical protein [Saprospiraceae bacterium]HMZ41014.1 hypothetical protein [Saprospiraceae bacterium]HNA65367.1 hypothetical protein [Saprospiraceae bacterium]